ncbi:MAG: 4-(cytidine 5'-diphospho)-2-C-methyl-D-erythritol kinase [Rhodobacteraceae bacterium]|nr:4-(cytidine 5'-diphospho)-2-C-methyl-D-erythritol kinase [Paracoccaceae bacterium]
MVEEFAPAKVNLTLHVTGQRADGYHLLDSLVVFADVGDLIRAAPSEGLGLMIDGPRGAGLSAGPDNLVLRATRLMGAQGATLRLTKHLPVSSGIGGGSADAAATLRALARLWHQPLPDPQAIASLGADVPVCLLGQSCRMSGVGAHLAPLPALPPVWLVLANPGVPLSTPAVFKALTHRQNPPMPALLPRFTTALGLAKFLCSQRNDLEPAARSLAPVIGTVLAALASQDGCLLARMSGSGATCFGLFASAPEAEAAARRLGQAQTDWWVASAKLLG